MLGRELHFNFPFTLILCSFIGLLLLSCSVKLPDIKITGEKTALENQILGEYKKVREDAWMISSERGSGDFFSSIPHDKKEIIEAVRSREFNKDDVDEFKMSKIFGENRDGLLEFIKGEEFTKLDTKTRQLAEKIILQENKDREIIIQRITDLNMKISSSTTKEIREAFFNLNVEESPEETYFKNKKGNWETK